MKRDGSEIKRNGSERKQNRAKFFHFNAKKVLFRLFTIDAKRRNLKQSETEMKKKQNEKEVITAKPKRIK
jgi:hypothetical protein